MNPQKMFQKIKIIVMGIIGMLVGYIPKPHELPEERKSKKRPS
jgi:hypothetical protein